MQEKSKSVWTIVLTIARYAIAVALGYLTGDGSVINEILQSMGAFRKKCKSQFVDHGSARIAEIDVFVSKEVKVNGATSTVVEAKRKNIHDYAKSLGLPTSEEYKLETMLRAGHVPEVVPVSGMLDNPDPTALENVGVGDKLFDKLVDMTPSVTPVVESPKTEQL